MARNSDKIEIRKIDEIIPYINNPRHNKEAVDLVAASISEFGFKNPIILDSKNVIVAGHTRFAAAKKLGLKEVPCIMADDLTEQQIKAFRLADNKVAEAATWDMDLLKIELDGITDIDMSNLGFDDISLSDEIGEGHSDVNEDDVPEKPDEPNTKVGDIYQLGKHRLICGDSTDVAVIGRLMDGAKADMVLSDPPYGMNLDTDFSTIKGSMKCLGRKNHTEGNKYEKVIGDNEDFKPELITTFFANFDYVKEMFLFGADYFAELLPDKNKGSWLVWDKRKESQADAIGSEFELIWSRNKHKRRMLRHDWFGFLSSENGADARNRVHPTQKPIALIQQLVETYSNPGDTILDNCIGSGTTAIACLRSNRHYIGFEMNCEYYEKATQRVQHEKSNPLLFRP